MRVLFTLLLALTAGAATTASQAQAQTEVDLELLLMVDVSRSMSPAELEIQRRGYAEALASDVVFAALQTGALQQIALSYVEWAGTGNQRVVVDWRLLRSQADLRIFARSLTANFSTSMRRTSISGALAYGAESLRANAYLGLRQVIDVSGDGPNNHGQPVTQARDATLVRGITINGLPLMTGDGVGAAWHLDDLDAYYRACVIGGPGAFVIPVQDWADFAQAVRRKLVLEIASRAPIGPIKAQYSAAPAYDCLIGEKIWQQRRQDYDDF